jgi:hypothetical protein
MPAASNSRQRADAKKSLAVTRLHTRLVGALAQRPVESVAAAVFAALMTGLLLNALALQSARHPSPLFAPPISLSPSAAASTEAPRPVPRPAAISSAPAAATTSTPPLAIPTRSVAAPHDAETAPTKAPDAIGEMLRAAPAAAPAASSAKPSAIESARILLVQKALMKLGYVVRPDGIIGTTTRQAIEKFERERGWPAHGELTPKVLREIAARSGLSIE